jgi:hypothetical protein
MTPVEMQIQLLRKPTVRILSELRSRLRRENAAWLSEFVTKGGVKTLAEIALSKEVFFFLSFFF